MFRFLFKSQIYRFLINRAYNVRPINKTMASALESYVNNTVSIITADGRNFVGTLKGFDQTINVILDESHERVFSSTNGIEQVVLGLHIIRGDNIAIIGQIDESIDSRLDFHAIRSEPLGPVIH